MPPRTAKQLLQIIIEGKDLSGPELSKLNDGLGKTEAKLNKVSQAGIAVGVGLATGLGAAVMQAAQLEAKVADALTLVETQGDEYAQMAEGMSNLAVGLSRDLGISADKIADGFYQVLSAGAVALTDEFEELTRTALIMSDLVGLETGRSVEVLSDTINAFSLEMGEASRVANIFFTASRLTATTVPQLAAAFTEAGPAAAALGLSIEEVATILDAFAAKGVKANKAGTALRILLTRLTAGTDETKAALSALDTEVFTATGTMRPIIDILEDMQAGYRDLSDEQKANTLKTIAGEEAFSKLAGILEGDLTVLRGWHRELGTATGMQDAFTKRQETLTGQLRLMKAELHAAAVEAGQVLLPTIKDVVGALKEHIGEMAGWVAANEGTIQGLGTTAALLIGGGGLLQAVVKVTAAIRTLKTVSLAAFGVGGAVVTGIGLVVAALVQMHQTSKNIADTLETIEGMKVERERKLLQPESLEEYKAALREVIADTEELAGQGIDVHVPIDDILELIPPLEYVKTQLATDHEFMVRGLVPAEEKLRLLSLILIDAENGYRRLRMAQADVEDSLPVITAEDLEAWRRQQAESAKAEQEMNRVRTSFQLWVEAAPLVRTSTDTVAEGWERALRSMPTEDQVRLAQDMAAALRNVEGPPAPPDAESERWKYEPEHDPGLVAPRAEDVIVGEQNMRRMTNAVNAGFQTMLQGGKIFENMFTAIWRNLAAQVLALIAEMITRMLVMMALKIALGIGTGGAGLAAQSGGTVTPTGGAVLGGAPLGGPMLQHGGTISRGMRGRDTIHGVLGKDETVLDHTLTDKMRDALDHGGMGGVNHVHVNIRPGIMTASDSEAVRFGRTTVKEVEKYERRYITEGTE